MTTYTIYPSADHHVQTNTETTYAIARAGSGTKTYVASDSYVNVGYNHTNRFHQAFMSFNLSSAGVETPGETVRLSLMVGDNIGTSTIKAGESAWSGGTGDFIAGASLTGLPLFGSMTPSSSARSEITKSGSVARSSAYKLALWGTQQENASGPGTHKYVGIYLSEAFGTTDDPYMTIAVPQPQGTLSATLGTVTGAASTAVYMAGTAAITLDAVGVAASAGATMPGTLAATLDAVAVAATATAVVAPTTPAARQMVFAANAQAERTITLARSA